MNRYLSYILFIYSFFLIHGCREDEFLDYELPSPSQMCVISGYICEDSTCIILTRNFKWSVSYQPDTSTFFLTGATVMLYENNSFLDTLRLIEVKNQMYSNVRYYYRSKKGGQAGKKYRIEVQYEHLPVALAETYMPSPPIVTIDTTVTIHVGNSYTENGVDTTKSMVGYQIDCVLSILDTDELSNFFQLRTDILYIKPNPIVENSYLASSNENFWPLFSDRMFAGKSTQFHLLDWLFENETSMLTILSLSEEGYRYYLSTSKYKHQESDFTTEPVDLYSNVHNGVGIFFGLSARSFTLGVPK